MKNYRLKSDAVKFFKEKYATVIHDYQFWESMGIDLTALEEVEEAYLTFGNKLGDNGNSLSGWGVKSGADFMFTIHFPSMKYKEYDEFKNGKVVRELMDKIQYQINRFCSDFTNKEE